MRVSTTLIMMFLIGFCLITCLFNWINLNHIKRQLIYPDIEIKELTETQERWVEHTEMLTTINRLSYSLQSAELDKRELIDTLDAVLKQNQQLKCLLQNDSIFKPDKAT